MKYIGQSECWNLYSAFCIIWTQKINENRVELCRNRITERANIIPSDEISGDNKWMPGCTQNICRFNLPYVNTTCEANVHARPEFLTNHMFWYIYCVGHGHVNTQRLENLGILKVSRSNYALNVDPIFDYCLKCHTKKAGTLNWDQK